jgi:hypothetical protein
VNPSDIQRLAGIIIHEATHKFGGIAHDGDLGNAHTYEYAVQFASAYADMIYEPNMSHQDGYEVHVDDRAPAPDEPLLPDAEPNMSHQDGYEVHVDDRAPAPDEPLLSDPEEGSKMPDSEAEESAVQ